MAAYQTEIVTKFLKYTHTHNLGIFGFRMDTHEPHRLSDIVPSSKSSRERADGNWIN